MFRHYNLEFCYQFGYPKQIKEHFVRILDQICQYLGSPSVRSIVLFGSTARGELSYRVNGDQIDIFSDYEFLIITKGRVGNDKVRELNQAFKKNKLLWNIRNPLFHIEFGINSTLKFLVKGPFLRNISNFEFQQNGIVFYSDNILGKQWGGSVNSKNLNFGDTNELVIERLWKQLDLACDSMLGGTPSPDVMRIMKYFTTRNALEILTVFLANEGVLIPTYKGKVEYFSENYSHRRYFPTQFNQFIQEALEAKLKPVFPKKYDYYYEQMLTGYLSLISYLIKGRSPNPVTFTELDDISDQLLTTDRVLFPDPLCWRWRYWRHDFRVAKQLEISQPIQWALREKRSLILSLLLYMHKWLLASIRHQKLPRRDLHFAQQLLAKIRLEDNQHLNEWESLIYEFREILAALRGKMEIYKVE